MVNDYALAAFHFLFIASNVVSYVILAIVLIRGRLVKQRSSLLLLNFAAADIINSICIFVESVSVVVPSFTISPDGFLTLTILGLFLLPSVVQTTLVLVNVSYVLETRKEHARLNSSRLLAAVMVASPWLYAFLVVMPFTAYHLDLYVAWLQGARLNTAHMLVSHVYPGLFACIATTLAVVSYVTRDRQEGNDGAISGGEVMPVDSKPLPQRGSNSEERPGMTSAAGTFQEAADDVMAQTRSPKAEVVYTLVSVALEQLSVYMFLGVVFAEAVGGDYEVLRPGYVARGFISVLRPAMFAWLWLLRPDYKKAFKEVICCGSRSGAHGN